MWRLTIHIIARVQGIQSFLASQVESHAVLRARTRTDSPAFHDNNSATKTYMYGWMDGWMSMYGWVDARMHTNSMYVGVGALAGLLGTGRLHEQIKTPPLPFPMAMCIIFMSVLIIGIYSG